MSVDVGRRVRVIIARQLAVPLTRLTDSAEFRRDLGVPGLAMVRTALDDEFGIALTNREIDFCQTVGTAIDLIKSKLENGGAFDRRALQR
jgi:acyl carrier protein